MITNKHKKRGQITIFIIIGILFFATFGIGAYFVSTALKTTSEQQLDKINQDLFQTSGLEEYTNRCLQKSLEDGIKQLGLQGGYFYSDQPGTLLPRALKIDRQLFNKNVTYLIINSFTTKAPEYPCFTGTIAPRFCNFFTKKSKYSEIEKHNFGKSTIPHLYKANTGFSIEEQLQLYIINKTKYCTNFEELLSRPEFKQYKVIEGDIIANVTFRDNDVYTHVVYPLVFEIKGKSTVIKKLDFEIDANVRFKKMFEVAQEIIQRDIDTIHFNPETEIQKGYFIDYNNQQKKLFFSDNDFQFQIERGSNDDVFTLTDKSTILGGDYFKFVFARENRPPVLDYVSLNPSPIIDLQKCKSNPQQCGYDVSAGAGSTLTIPIGAVDPDEDPLYYKFSGWKSEYSTSWDDFLEAPLQTDSQPSVTQHQFELWENDNQVTKRYPDGTTVVYSTLSAKESEGLTQVEESTADNGYYLVSTRGQEYLTVTFNGENIGITSPQSNPNGASLLGQSNSVSYLGPGTHTVQIKGTNTGFALDYFEIDGSRYQAEPFVGSDAEKYSGSGENFVYFDYVSTDPGTGWEQVRDDIFYKKHYGTLGLSRGQQFKGAGYAMASWKDETSIARLYFLGSGIRVFGFPFPRSVKGTWVLDPKSLNQKSGIIQSSQPIINVDKISNTRHLIELKGNFGLDYFEVLDYPSPWSVSNPGPDATASIYLQPSDRLGGFPQRVTVSVSDNQYSDYQDVYVVTS